MSFDDVLKLVQQGGNALLLFVIWIAWNAASEAKEAVKTLKSIDEGLSKMRNDSAQAHREIISDIEATKAAIEFLPIKMRAVR